MAKTQRWRRGRSAGEGTASVVDGSPDDPVTAELDDLDDAPAPGVDELEELEEPEELDELDGADEPDGPDDADDADDADDSGGIDAAAEPDVIEEAAEAEVVEDVDGPEDPEDPEDLDPRDDLPPLPHVPERAGGLAGLLLGGRNPADVVAVQLLQAAHAKQALSTALAMGVVAAVAGRPAREAGVVLLTVLVGQTILGWHNDIVDRERDKAHGLAGKPLATGRLEAGTVWYAIVVATLLLVPLAITTGIRAGCLYLAAVAVGMLGNVLLRTGVLSWWSWAVSFALLPAYLSYGGWGGQAVGSAPETPIVVLAALLGIGVHFMRAVWGLVADHEDGWTYLPLKLGLKLGATRLLALATVYTAAIVIALVAVGVQVGLSR